MSYENPMLDSRVYSRIHGEDCWPKVDKVSPCEDACPIHMDVPSYVLALSQGKFQEALDLARLTNPFPYVCGTVCHHPCETACYRELVDKAIAIRDLKRFIGQYQEKSDKPAKQVERTRNERVAIIGSGPAGLTAAHDLVKLGYGVSVFEALPVAGGMLAAGIPDFILPKKPVKIEVDYIRALGVDIKTNIRIGRDLSLDDLWKQDYKAVLISSGAWESSKLPIPGKELKGVLPALDFLRNVKLGEKIKLKGIVCIIGGGNTAIDAARCAIRLGAAKVIMACLESRTQLPSYDWEIEAAEKEGIQVWFSLAAQDFIGRVGKIKRINFKRVADFSRDNGGKISWTLKEGADSEVSLEVDTVIVAIGQTVDTSFTNGVKLKVNGAIKNDSKTMTTNQPGLFAAGDVVTTVGTVVDAIAAGHKASQSIDCYLKKIEVKKSAQKQGKEIFQFEEELIPSFLLKKDRWNMPAVCTKDAIRSFGPTELGYAEWQVIEEAKRCMNCRMCGNCLFGRGQLCFETSTRLMASK